MKNAECIMKTNFKPSPADDEKSVLTLCDGEGGLRSKTEEGGNAECIMHNAQCTMHNA